MSLSFVASSKTSNGSDRKRYSPTTHIIYNSAAVSSGSGLYYSIGGDAVGLSHEAFDNAWKGYQRLLNEGRIPETRYLTICDLSVSSRRKRFFIIDVTNEKIVTQTWVAHGQNSGAEYAERFSNQPESLQSSLGFYITHRTYTGNNGLSLRLEGLEPGYNSKAMERTIVIHGADYVDGARARAGYFMGRSWGCPAVPRKEAGKIINTIKNGTLLFIYHPGGDYLQKSKILND